MFIYMLMNKLNGKCYIGLTTKPDVNIRIRQHRNSVNCPNHRNSKTAISRAIKKYGWDAFEVFVLEQCDDVSTLEKLEVEWIAHYNSQAPNGYNLTSGGERYEISEEQRAARSKRMKGRKMCEETKKKLSEKAKGRVASEETRRKISEAGRGRKMSEETKLKIKTARERTGLPGHRCKLTWKIVREIRSEYSRGELTQYDLADLYGVSVATISRIVKNKIWIEEGVEAIDVDHRYLAKPAIHADEGIIHH